MSIFSAIGNVVSNVYNNRKQHELYQQQKADSIEMWNMQNEYNTPAAQAARMRQAGINPDLQGVDGGNAASPAETPKQEFTSLDLSTAFDSAFQGTLQFIASIQDLKGKSIANDMAAVQAYFGADNDLAGLLSAYGADPNGETGNIVNALSLGNNHIPGLSRRGIRRLNMRFSELANSDYGKAILLGQTNDLGKAREEYRTRHANPLYDDSLELDEAVLEFYRELINAQYQSNRTSRYRGVYEEDYYSNLNPEAAAGAVNTGNARQSSQNVLYDVINRLFRKYVKEGNFAGSVFFFNLYTRLMGSGSTGIGSAVGSVAGAALGGPTGATIGSAIGNGIF